MSSSPQQALVVIDIQNDYFPGGAFPLWQADETLERILSHIAAARAQGQPIVFIQHVADPQQGLAPFFNADTPGVALHERLLASAPEAKIIQKSYADSFLNTGLDDYLRAHGVGLVQLCGMMTQNCVTHTALSKQAEAYQIQVLADACTSVSAMIHLIALNALAPRGIVVR